ncbi:MAG: hypothetical protein F4217_04595 [Acidimicrobiaceae bacterium]|nr:hypothetical protein [Acidimicrobiaceae bacterium]
MKDHFNSGEFVRGVGEELVRAFSQARQATTSGLVGGAIENPVRKSLEQILPRGIAIASGCVIDTTGRTSRQIDVVAYERDICPRFSVNETPESTYFPCEGVIAVGEVKSRVGTKELRDAFGKIASVKRLKRTMHKVPLPFPSSESSTRVFRRTKRSYGEVASGGIPTYSDDYSHQHPNDDVLGYILTSELTISHDTALDHFVSLLGEYGTASPDILVSLDGTVIYGCKPASEAAGVVPALFIRDRTSLVAAHLPDPFAHLIGWIYTAYYSVKTAEIEVFRQYLADEASGSVRMIGSRP